MRFRRIGHGVVDSTSERAFAAIAVGAARHGDAHIAAAQTAGRGRFGRAWHSPLGEGLYLSVVLLPPPPLWNPAGLTMAAGLAALDAVVSLGLRDARLKWPNDLVVGAGGPAEAAKLAGVLVETRGLSPDQPRYVVGVGMNVRQRAFPAELAAERPVTSLALLGLDVSVESACDRVLDALAVRIGQVAADHRQLEEDFLRATGLAGARVLARVGEQEADGTLEGLSIAEGLILRRADGRASRIPLELVRAVDTAEPSAIRAPRRSAGRS